MSHLLNKFADKLQGNDHDNDNDNRKEDRGQEERVSEHQRGIRQGTRRKQEYNSESLYSGTSKGYEGVPSEDTGAYAHSGNTGRDKDSGRAYTSYTGISGRDEQEDADQDTFAPGKGQGQGQRTNRGVGKDWSEGSGNEEMMGSSRRGGNW